MLKKSLVLAGAGLLALSAVIVALPGEGEGEKEVRVEKVIVKCDDGADCAERHHAMIAAHHGMGHHRAKSFLGVSLTELTPELKTHFGTPEDAGVMVSRVHPETPAARAGLQAGDIITAVDGEAVRGAGALSSQIGKREAGVTVQLEVWREGRVELLSAGLEAPPHKERTARVIKIDCDEGEDCDIESSFDCGDEEECEVRVECDGGECTCTVNGEPADCEQIHPMHRRHHG